MNRWKMALIAIASLIVLSPAHARAELKIMTEKLPPFNFEENGEVVGISADLLLLAMEEAGQPAPRSAIQVFPWARAYTTVQREPNTVLFSMARTEQREPLFQWVGPIYDLTIGLIARRDRNIVLNSIADAGQYTIGTIRDGAPEQLVIAGGYPLEKLDRLTDPSLNLKKLEAGRIDLFAFNVPTTFFMMRQAGMDPGDYEVVYTLKKAALFYGFHKDTDPELIRKLNTAVSDLKQPDETGRSRYRGIVETYLGAP
jgi:polar amino acid transport system substrate-binding protein